MTADIFALENILVNKKSYSVVLVLLVVVSLFPFYLLIINAP